MALAVDYNLDYIEGTGRSGRVDTSSQRLYQTKVLERNLLELNPNRNSKAFYGMTLRMPNKPSRGNHKFQWGRDQTPPNFAVLGEAADVTDTSETTLLVGTNLNVLIPNARYKVVLNTGYTIGEQLLVQSVSQANGTATFQRGFGGSTPAALFKNARLLALSNVIGETAGNQVGIYADPELRWNVCTPRRWTCQFTNRQAKKAWDFGPSELDHKSKQTLQRAMEEMATDYYFNNVRVEDVWTDDGSASVGAGSDYFLTSNVFDAGGSPVTQRWLRECIDQLSLYGSGVKTVFASSQFIGGIIDIFEGRLTFAKTDISAVEKFAYNIGLARLDSVLGTTTSLNIVMDHLLTREQPGSAYVFDMAYVRKRSYEAGMNSTGTEPGTLHWMKSPYGDALDENQRWTRNLASDEGIEWGAEELHGKFINVTGGGAWQSLTP